MPIPMDDTIQQPVEHFAALGVLSQLGHLERDIFHVSCFIFNLKLAVAVQANLYKTVSRRDMR